MPLDLDPRDFNYSVEAMDLNDFLNDLNRKLNDSQIIQLDSWQKLKNPESQLTDDEIREFINFQIFE
jgi:hypothetical protein